MRQVGKKRYHDRYLFHRLLHSGRLDRRQVQTWALNRYYYQSRLPAKDAFLVARLPVVALRCKWRRRLLDNDGKAEGTGGIARWLKLAQGLGLDPDYVESTEGLLPATHFAVDAYVKENATTAEAQAPEIATLRFKCDVLGAQLDALHHAYVSRRQSPRAFVLEDWR